MTVQSTNNRMAPSGPLPPTGQKPALPTPNEGAQSAGAAMAGDRYTPSAGAGQRTVRDAKAAAESLWFEEIPEGLGNGMRGDILRMGKSIDAPPFPEMKEELETSARQQAQANRPLEAAALKRLSAEEQFEYQKVSCLAEEKPLARVALQLLLLDGRLPGDRRASDGTNLLQALEEFTGQELAPGFKREELFSNMLQELAMPSAINQETKQTCTATAMQIMTAREHPAEYVRLLNGLASPAGEVRLANGDKIRREPGLLEEDSNVVQPQALRTFTSRLWQSALMEYGNQDMEYDNATDYNYENGVKVRQGLLAGQVRHMLAGLSNEDVELFQRDSCDLDHVVARIAERTRHGKAAAVGLYVGEKNAAGNWLGAHEMLVTKVDGDKVYLNNPYGKEETMPLSEFKDRFYHGTVPRSDD